ncbi:MAG: hypothetical protein FJ221_06275 [Lentisphaerae bacterium]|nr:hypothetical protein [Lentisphaerota bacterium]
MVKTRILVAVPAVLAVAVGIGWLLRPTDEARIRRALADLVAAVGKDGPESPVGAARRAERASGWFLPDCEVRIERAGFGTVATRGELRQAIFQARAALDSIRIGLYDPSVTVSADRASAVHGFTVRAEVRHRGDPESAVQEVRIEWRRTPDGWRIRSVSTVEGIREIR